MPRALLLANDDETISHVLDRGSRAAVEHEAHRFAGTLGLPLRLEVRDP